MKDPTWFFTAIAIFSVLAIGLSNIGVALGQGKATAAAMEGIARQPEASGKILITLLLGLAMMEALSLYVLVMGLLFMFANPFIKYIVP